MKQRVTKLAWLLAVAYAAATLWLNYPQTTLALQAVGPNWHPAGKQRITLVENGCLIAAEEMEAAVTARDGLLRCTWARIVRVDLGARQGGHAVLCFQLRNGDVYAFDTVAGSRPLHTRATDIASLRRALWWDFPLMRSAAFLD